MDEEYHVYKIGDITIKCLTPGEPPPGLISRFIKTLKMIDEVNNAPSKDKRSR